MIDFSRPVYLRKMVIDKKTGNTYIPLKDRPYLPGELPERLLTAENCYQDEVPEEVEPVVTTKTIEPPPALSSSNVTTTKLEAAPTPPSKK